MNLLITRTTITRATVGRMAIAVGADTGRRSSGVQVK